MMDVIKEDQVLGLFGDALSYAGGQDVQGD